MYMYVFASSWYFKLLFYLFEMFCGFGVDSCPFISSPEPKAHGELIVYRSIRRPSVRPSVSPSVRKHFQTQISPQPVGQS